MGRCCVNRVAGRGRWGWDHGIVWPRGRGRVHYLNVWVGIKQTMDRTSPRLAMALGRTQRRWGLCGGHTVPRIAWHLCLGLFAISMSGLASSGQWIGRALGRLWPLAAPSVTGVCVVATRSPGLPGVFVGWGLFAISMSRLASSGQWIGRALGRLWPLAAPSVTGVCVVATRSPGLPGVFVGWGLFAISMSRLASSGRWIGRALGRLWPLAAPSVTGVCVVATGFFGVSGVFLGWGLFVVAGVFLPCEFLDGGPSVGVMAVFFGLAPGPDAVSSTIVCGVCSCRVCNSEIFWICCRGIPPWFPSSDESSNSSTSRYFGSLLERFPFWRGAFGRSSSCVIPPHGHWGISRSRSND